MGILPEPTPPDLFLGHTGVFWTGFAAIAAATYTTLVIPTLVFIFLQVRAASTAFQFNATQRLLDLVDDFKEDLQEVFRHCPIQLVAKNNQFSRHPPKRHTVVKTKGDRVAKTTPEQRHALEMLDQFTRDRIVRVIERLNDIGQLVEDGFVSRTTFLGKHHVMIIQCCHMVEVVRQDEQLKRGGNYGHRLLRMRRWAINYNDAWPKHRAAPIKVYIGENGPAQCVIYRSPHSSSFARVMLRVRGLLSWYGA